jgi:hypothetical protein
VNNQHITVIVINSALMQSETFFSGYDLVVMDEVHTYNSKCRKEIFKKATCNTVLAMSATTDNRKDGFDVIMKKELAVDGVIYAENIPGFDYGEDAAFDTHVNVIKYNGPPEYTKALRHESTGNIFTSYMNKQYIADPHRMKLVIRELRKLYDWRGPNNQEHRIFVFCEERNPLKTVFDALVASFGDAVAAPELTENANNEEKINLLHMQTGEFIGGIKDDEIRRIVGNAKIILTTYGYSGTGISIRDATAILFLTPRRANMQQILARVMRRGSDLTIPRMFIDILDNKTSARYQYGDRALAYDFYKMDVSVTKVSYTDLPV